MRRKMRVTNATAVKAGLQAVPLRPITGAAASGRGTPIGFGEDAEGAMVLGDLGGGVVQSGAPAGSMLPSAIPGQRSRDG